MSVFRLSGDKPGAQLKLDTRADAEPHLRPLVESRDFVEVHFGGHTLGVGACEAVADALKTHEIKLRQLSRAEKKSAEPEIEEEIVPAPTIIQTAAHEAEEATTPSKPRKPGQRDPRNEPIRCLTYKDPFDAVYKKYVRLRRSRRSLIGAQIFTADGSYLLGGMMMCVAAVRRS